MAAIGHLFGYGLGTIDLLKVFGTTLGDSQFKQLTLIAAFTLLFAVLVTSFAVEERVLISTRYPYHGSHSSCYGLTRFRDADAKPGAVKMVSKILKTTWHLPDRIQAICWVQFWAWIGKHLSEEPEAE